MTTEELEQTLTEKFFPGEPPRPYITAIDAAFDVLTKLRSQGWFWRLDSVHDGAICTLQNLERKTYSIRSDTAAKAICECALKTLEK